MGFRKIELNDMEVVLITDALNAYWNEARKQLNNDSVYASNGTKLPLGDIEKKYLIMRKELTLPIIKRFETELK